MTEQCHPMLHLPHTTLRSCRDSPGPWHEVPSCHAPPFSDRALPTLTFKHSPVDPLANRTPPAPLLSPGWSSHTLFLLLESLVPFPQPPLQVSGYNSLPSRPWLTPLPLGFPRLVSTCITLAELLTKLIWFVQEVRVSRAFHNAWH